MIRKDNALLLIGSAHSSVMLMANILSAKMIHLSIMRFDLPAGLIFYPLTFLMMSLATELFGSRKARRILLTSLSINLFSLIMIKSVQYLPTLYIETQLAFDTIFGLSGLRIGASLIACSVAQAYDVYLFRWIKACTGSHLLWVRSQGSAAVSQLIDTILIDFLFLYYGLKMSAMNVWEVILISFLYKIIISVLYTPLLYLGNSLLKNQPRQR